MVNVKETSLLSTSVASNISMIRGTNNSTEGKQRFEADKEHSLEEVKTNGVLDAEIDSTDIVVSNGDLNHNSENGKKLSVVVVSEDPHHPKNGKVCMPLPNISEPNSKIKFFFSSSAEFLKIANLNLEPLVVLERISTTADSLYKKPPDKKRKRTNHKAASDGICKPPRPSERQRKNGNDLSEATSENNCPESNEKKRRLSNDEDEAKKAKKKRTPRPPYTKPLPRGRKKKPHPPDEDETDAQRKALRSQVKEQIKRKKEKPVELFRKDLISAMKLPDTETLERESYWLITDSWRKEWEEPVQVPVNPKAIPYANVRDVRKKENWRFRLPQKRYLRFEKTKNFNPEHDILAAAVEMSGSMCPYDLDTLDLNWLELLNYHRAEMGLPLLTGEAMEQLIYDFECQAEDYFKKARKNEEVMWLTYDENVACDICRKIYTEDGNEIVFCESCNISVHQFCYGITKIPQGSWLCHTCVLGIRPSCVLCPNLGGAMKNIKDQHKWVHVSCAIWIPEVEISRLNHIGSIIQIDQIPESRWTLSCSICHIKEGACIQCSVKSCKVAYHVTCGYNEKLDMTYSLEDGEENTESFFESFCKKHCVSSSVDFERENVLAERERKILELESNFFKFVNLSDTKDLVKLNYEDSGLLVDLVYNYWLLKRRSNLNKPIFQFESEENKLNQVKEDNINVRKNTYKGLRSSLEKSRNLAYMICTREKKKKALIKVKYEIFMKQYEMLKSGALSSAEADIVLNANLGSSIYDQLGYSYKEPPMPETLVIDHLYGNINCLKVDKKKKDGRRSREKKDTNPYAKHYMHKIRSPKSQQQQMDTSASSSANNVSSCSSWLEGSSEENSLSTITSAPPPSPILITISKPSKSKPPKDILLPSPSKFSKDILLSLPSKPPKDFLLTLQSKPPKDILQPTSSKPPKDILQPTSSKPPKDILQPTSSKPPKDILQSSPSKPPKDILLPYSSKPPKDILQPSFSKPPKDILQPSSSKPPEDILQPSSPSKSPEDILLPSTPKLPKDIPISSASKEIPLPSKPPKVTISLSKPPKIKRPKNTVSKPRKTKPHKDIQLKSKPPKETLLHYKLPKENPPSTKPSTTKPPPKETQLKKTLPISSSQQQTSIRHFFKPEDVNNKSSKAKLKL